MHRNIFYKSINEILGLIMKYINSALIITATVLFTYATSSTAKINASFSCDKATQPVEHAICSNEKLANLDKEMAQTYKEKRKKSSNDEVKKLKKEQILWMKKRILNCEVSKSNHKDEKVINCLISSYTNRISELQNNEVKPLSFYKESLIKKQFTMSDRLKWKKLVKWPNSCFFDRLEYMSNAGLVFYKVHENTYILEVMCDRSAYQAEYEIFTIINLPNKINAVKLELPQIKFKNEKWHSYQSNKIIGHFQFYKEDNTLLNIHKYSGAGQCGHSVSYEIIMLDEKAPKTRMKSAHGNDDCSKDISVDDWPKILLNTIQ